MRNQIAARIGRLEDRRRPTADLPSKEQRDACVRDVLSDPERVMAVSASLHASPAHIPMAHVIAAALRADT